MGNRTSVESRRLTGRVMSAAVQALANEEIAAHSQRFFKTGPGQYGEGDRFLGVRVPAIRSLVKRFRHAPLTSVGPLIKSSYHEERLFAVLLCNEWCKPAGGAGHAAVYDFYMRHRQYVNNWGLVDGSAPGVVGGWLRDHNRSVLYELAGSESYGIDELP
jgi:hypothetical protein